MGNLVGNLKKFLANKNTVTILGVFACIIVLYIGYNYRVNQKVQFVSVLYATQQIDSNTQITEKMFSTIQVNSDLVKKATNIAKNVSDIKDDNNEFMYVKFDSTIPANGIIYKDSLIAKADKPDSKLEQVPEGKRYQYLEVDMSSTLGNAISPGASIDIYAYISDTDGKRFGKLYSNVQVVDVVDSSWYTTSGDKEKEPDLLIVLVAEEDYRLLEKAKRIRGIELIPAPNNYSYEDSDKDTKITSIDIETYIQNQYTILSDED